MTLRVTELITRREKCSQLVSATLPAFLDETMPADRLSGSCMLIIDENVRRIHPWVEQELGSRFDHVALAVVPSGEGSKSVRVWAELVDIALNARLRRSSPVFAVGGGVTGDLAGFVAASVLRGLPLYHVPTTLLAMVDSAIGGKTGINHSTGKNLIGAFYQPEAVVTDVRFLETLPQREWNCGLGEVIKYGCIRDTEIIDTAELVTQGNRGSVLDDLILRCAAIKAEIVMEDELETGSRAFLNYGHTFAHALEAHTKFSMFAHGEAVYVGLLAATHFSSRLGADVNPDRILRFRDTFRLKTHSFVDQIDALIEAMFSDKKIQTAKLRLVLLREWGVPYLLETDDMTGVRESWEFALKNADIG